jgi:hypothetical protein
MSPNRKAELQRKLVLAPVPRPPKGLAERIKSDIPKQLALDTEKERRRFSQSIAFNLRVAASILLLISSVYLCIDILSRTAKEKSAIANAERILSAPEATSRPMPPAAVALDQASQAPLAPQVAATDAIAPQKKSNVERDQPTPIVAEVRSEPLAEHRDLEKRDKEETRATADDRKEGAVAGNIAPAPVAPMIAAVPPPAAPAEAPARAAVAEKITVTASAPSILREAQAADLSLGMPSTLFGINVAAKDNSTTTLVQRFAAPATRPSRGVRLEADAAPSPYDATTQLLRVSVDLPAADVQNGAAIPPIASDATLTIEFDDAHVRAHRPIAAAASPTERVLVANTSATALYELELEPKTGRRDVIATVTLSYTSVRDGKKETITRTIRRGDIARSWERASKRMKAASLGAAAQRLPADVFAAKAKEAGVTGYADSGVITAPAAVPPPP